MRLVAPPCRPRRRLSPAKHNNGVSPPLRSLNKDSLQFQPPPPVLASSSSSSSSSRISPAVLFTIIILAAIFFVAGLLHLLVRFLLRKRSGSGGGSGSAASAAELQRSGTLQRQLQQLFHLHDAGLDQAFIDSLPLFLYREILRGSDREPFDCAVCLCEFALDDKLRLLPVCGHAFHLACIDAWLLSNSTCPLCRGLILVHSAAGAFENPVFAFGDSAPENDGSEEEGLQAGGRTLPVRLGKFKKPSEGEVDGVAEEENSIAELGETSSSSLDARRCFSMGYYQYVVADAGLQVAINAGRINLRNAAARGSNEASKGKRLGIGSRDESLSVSKIWQWSEKKATIPVSSADAAAAAAALPWIRSSGEDT